MKAWDGYLLMYGMKESRYFTIPNIMLRKIERFSIECRKTKTKTKVVVKLLSILSEISKWIIIIIVVIIIIIKIYLFLQCCIIIQKEN